MKTDVSPPNVLLSSSPTGRGIVSLKQRAYAELKRRILSGALPPGELLSERQLARSLKMSKTPVHAALERLEGDGLVIVTAQQGIVVRAISPQDIADHFEIREALETFVVARLAGQLTAEQVSSAEAEPRRSPPRRAAGRHRGAHPAGLRVPPAPLRVPRQRARSRVRWARFATRSYRVMHHISTRFPTRMSEALSEHEAIFSSLLSGDGPAASERMATHLRNGVQSIYRRHP